MDFIHIRDLSIRCIIGIFPEERVTLQEVVLNLRLGTDAISAAARSDDIADTIDYKALKQRIRALVEASSFNLIETLADRVAALCLEDPRTLEVRVTVDKPGALRFARSVAVEVTRRRS